MKYTEVVFHVNPGSEEVNEILIALLSEIGYDSFADTEEDLKAYIPTSSFDKSSLETLLSEFPVQKHSISYQSEEMEDKDWNEEWEKNFFQPIVIGERCVIHSSFHKDIPKTEYRIMINPKMAFGTGHHETTSLILEELLEADLKDKRLLDMGCGTSILAILASMRGANPITAIDIDDWCVDNSIENLKLNEIHSVHVMQGDASSLKDMKPFDIIIANINRNILLNDMPAYVQSMVSGGHIWMSGFYENDIPVLCERAESLGLHYLSHRKKHNWATVHFQLKE